MKKRKLKGFVLPTLYLLITICIFTGVILIGSSLNFEDTKYNYGTSILKDNVKTVIVEDKITTSAISSPVDEGIPPVVHFYDYKDTEENQKNSLIFYENTYLPNTGTLYASDNDFLVKTIFAGKVTNIAEDEFFGKYIVIEHSNNLVTYYYGIDEIEVQIGDELTSGAVLGKSKNNEILNTKKSFLLEVYHNNELVNPEKVIGTKITDYK